MKMIRVFVYKVKYSFYSVTEHDHVVETEHVVAGCLMEAVKLLLKQLTDSKIDASIISAEFVLSALAPASE